MPKENPCHEDVGGHTLPDFFFAATFGYNVTIDEKR